jgi:hypothetical protein
MFGIIERVATVLVRSKTASTFSRCTARQPFAEMFSGVATNCPPALFTSTSIRPNRSSAASTRASTCSGSRTSAGTAKASVPAASSSARVSSSGSGRRPASTSEAPVRANSREISRPSPVPPPVTMTIEPAFASSRSGETGSIPTSCPT